MKKKILLCMMFFLPMLIQAQFMHQAPVGVALFNNATLLPPASFTAIFNQPFHPGISVSYEFGWKKKEYSKWFQDASLGFFNHRYAYKAILLVSKAGNRKTSGTCPWRHLSMPGICI
ncbi:MAG: hypothetical protein IPH84_11835 [Bacteroidales bacterium]|nr:hypothetical protein [Bacteroidales bacterium]